jgi:hypothetical protein
MMNDIPDIEFKDFVFNYCFYTVSFRRHATQIIVFDVVLELELDLAQTRVRVTRV